MTLVEALDRVLPKEDPAAARVLRAALERDGVEVLAGTRVASVERTRERAAAARGEGRRGAGGRRRRAARGGGAGAQRGGAGAGGGRHPLRPAGEWRSTTGSAPATRASTPSGTSTAASPSPTRRTPRRAWWCRTRSSSDAASSPTWSSRGPPTPAPRSPTSASPPPTPPAREEEVESITIPFTEVDRARLDGETDGFLRVYLKRGSDTILGATLVAEHAGDVISQVTAAMTAGTGLGRAGEDDLPLSHPGRGDPEGRRRLGTAPAHAAGEEGLRAVLPRDAVIWRSAVGGRRSAVGGRRSAVGGRRSAVGGARVWRRDSARQRRLPFILSSPKCLS